MSYYDPTPDSEYLQDAIEDIERLEKENKKLKEQLEVAREALSFYDTQGKGWTNSKALYDTQDDYSEFAGMFPMNDNEILQEGSDSCNLFSGKTAREALKRIGEIEKGSP